MATAQQLLRLYPRAWRARYGSEFLETAGPERLGAQQVIDITMGAIDAWLSADVRRVAGVKSQWGGTPMTVNAAFRCSDTRLRMTTRDSLVSAGVLIGASLVLSIVGIWANRSGYHDAGEILKGLAFPVSLLVSMPFGVMKGQPRRAQGFVLGVCFVILLALGYVSVRL